MRYCSTCVLPASSAVKLTFDEKGICSACSVAAERTPINWEERGKMLKKLTDQYRSKNGSNYDCIVTVSGGKDSYFQTHYATKVLGLKPLLVTYHGNNYLPEGERNLKRMRHVFDVDHLIFRPSEILLKKLNLLTFRKMGDMNWQNHCGIFTYPVQIAAQHQIPLLIWGEHGYTELGGMYSMNDFPEMTAKYRLEHAQRGFDWHDMIDEDLGIKEQDVLWAKYPDDETIEKLGIRGIYLGHYVHWDPNKQTEEMMRLYDWRGAEQPFERTYRTMSNLDDRYENGAHDYLKFVKFGYGRATDHASKDIRGGYMTREKGIEMVKKYDHVRSSDISYWCEYVGISEEEFDHTADTFRDPRVWWIKGGEWWKHTLWGEPEAFGKVHLSEEEQKKYRHE